MQSGLAKTQRWILEYESGDRKFIEPLMGWTGSRDTRQQLRMMFNSAEEAKEFADKHGLQVRLHEPQAKTPKRRPYAGNFASNKRTYAD